MSEPTTALTIVQQTTEKVKLISVDGLIGILVKNDTRVGNANVHIQKLLHRINTEGMTPELDALANNILSRVRVTDTEIKAERMVYTKVFDEIKAGFTAIEKRIDSTNQDSGVFKLQKSRNDYAAKVRKEQAERELEIQRKLATERETIEVKIEIEKMLNNAVIGYTTGMEQKMQADYSNLTLENKDTVIGLIESVSGHTGIETLLEGLKAKQISYKSLSADTIKKCMVDIVTANTERCVSEYNTIISRKRQHLLDIIPSRIAELQEIAEAGKRAKKKLEQEAEQRRLKQEEQMRQDEAARKEKAEKELEAKAAVEKTNASFTATVEAKPITPMSAARVTLEIEVKNPAAFLLIFQFYFEREGYSLSIEELNRKTLLNMVKFAEAEARKSPDNKIISEHIEYKNKTVAVNNKPK